MEPWGKFAPALNALVACATRAGCNELLLQSKEVGSVRSLGSVAAARRRPTGERHPRAPPPPPPSRDESAAGGNVARP